MSCVRLTPDLFATVPHPLARVSIRVGSPQRKVERNRMNSQPPDNPYRASSNLDQPGRQPYPGVHIPHSETDSTGGIIPYKNPHALIAYYLGLFSLLPCVGIALAIPALILGVIGLRNRNRNPQIRGSVHAWIGIVMGSLMTLLWGTVLILALVGTVLAQK